MSPYRLGDLQTQIFFILFNILRLPGTSLWLDYRYFSLYRDGVDESFQIFWNIILLSALLGSLLLDLNHAGLWSILELEHVNLPNQTRLI